jgi:prepilin-type processing-associated H-X9-DG protein
MTEQNSKMSETEKVEQGQKPKTSLSAIASIVLAILSVLFLFLAPVAIIFGILSIVKIRKQKGKLSGAGLAIVGIVVSVLVLVVVGPTILRRIREVDTRLPCGANLSSLGKAMLIYANNYNDTFPTPNKWCDLLVEHGGLSKKQFRCSGAKRGPCNYAMNPNCEPNSPEDVVLLFETKGGWNQCGGPEILTTGNHYGRCNILFNDGHVEYVGVKRIGELKWK